MENKNKMFKLLVSERPEWLTPDAVQKIANTGFITAAVMNSIHPELASTGYGPQFLEGLFTYLKVEETEIKLVLATAAKNAFDLMSPESQDRADASFKEESGRTVHEIVEDIVKANRKIAN